MDYSAITSAVDFAGVITAVGTVAAALAGVYIAMKGANILLSFLR